MKEADKLYMVRDRLEGEDRTRVNECIEIQNNLVFQLIELAGESLKQTVQGEETAKPKPDPAEAKEALKTIHDYGEKLDLAIPVFEDDRSFLYWLINDYARSMLCQNIY